MPDRNAGTFWFWSLAGLVNYGIFWLAACGTFPYVQFPPMGGRGPVGVHLPVVIALVGGIVILLGSLLHARLRDYGLGPLTAILPWVTLWWIFIHAG